MASAALRVGGAVVGTLGTAIMAILAHVAANEGGYVNHPSDPGGETNHGVTAAVARKYGYTGPMRDLPKETARAIYIKHYIEEPGFVPVIERDPLAGEEVVDSAVNFGPPRPSKWLQQSINRLAGNDVVAVDGQIGPRTIAAFERLQREYGKRETCLFMVLSLDAYQTAEYKRLVRVNPKLRTFFYGWINQRVGNVDPGRCGA